MKTRNWVAMTWLLALLGMGPVTATLAVELVFWPQDQILDLGDDGRLAVALTEPLEVRTIELEVQFNENILQSLSGAAGAAFDELPCYVWQDYSEEEGVWNGFAVAIGADCYLVGPGELYVWDFSALAEGMSAVTALNVRMYDHLGEEILDVELSATTVLVGDGVAATQEILKPSPTQVQVVPNPFNPNTRIEFTLEQPDRIRLAIFDMRGRQVRSLYEGEVQAGLNSLPWDGLSDQGRALPSGVYLYRLDMEREQCFGRLTLAR